ncbi:CBFD_NFYB_HMF domain-containing protein [Pseudozyma hubeiensis]|nr:CBFD_NFYB_HMF domain-containing protein [Pseudozyma hubeiensis]
MSQPGSPTTPEPSSSSVSPSKASKPQRGTSIFPTARVSRIIKADRDVDICSKEATFLISIATEIFIKKLTDEAYTNAKLDKRKNVFYKDLSRAVQQNEHLEFLKDAIPTPVALSTALEARENKAQQKQLEEEMILEGTLQDEEEDEEEEEEDEEDDEGNDADADAAEEGADGVEQQDDAEPAKDAAPESQSSKPTKKKAASKKSPSKSQPSVQTQDGSQPDDMDQDDD